MSIQDLTEDRIEARQAAGESASGGATLWKRIAAALQDERWMLRIALLLVLVLYVRTVAFAPVYDDNVVSQWDSGWRDIPKFFTHDIFGSDGKAHSVYYRPLPMTYAFFVGTVTGGAPGWLHLDAIFLHMLVLVLSYSLGRKLFGDVRLAMLTSLLFVLHPSKVESVAWIGSSFVDGLGGVLFFATLLAFLKWHESGAARWMAASVALFAGAMFTKETMLSIPILIASYLWLNSRDKISTARIARLLLPYGVVWAAYMAIRHQVIKPAGTSATYIHPTFTHNYIWTAPDAIWWYLRHLVMPWGLSAEYAPRVIDHPTLANFVLPAIGAATLLAVVLWLCWRRSKVAVFLLLWFVLTLAPPVIVAPMVLEHDRYLYLAAYAFCALLAWAILRLGTLALRARLALAICAMALCFGLSWHEIGYWDNDFALWSRVLEISPSHLKGHAVLASLYKMEGDTPRAMRVVDDGLRFYPNSPNLWMVRAGILFANRQQNEARNEYLKVMQLTDPASSQAARFGTTVPIRAAAALILAKMDLKANQYAEAERYVRTAMALNPDGTGYHETLSECLRGEGKLDEANAENLLELRENLARLRSH